MTEPVEEEEGTRPGLPPGALPTAPPGPPEPTEAELERIAMAELKDQCDRDGEIYPDELKDYIARTRGLLEEAE